MIHTRQVWIAAWFAGLISLLLADAGLAEGDLTLRRIGHSEVRQACMSDGSARMQHYWDVAAFDWGGVAPLNSWYHPQLMQFDPVSGGFHHSAMALPHEGQGNEDDPRQRLFAHKSSEARKSSLFFTIFGYEEIDDENGEHRRDSAVMALRPTVDGNRMPRRTARVVNLPVNEAKRGLGEIPASCGAPYDPIHRIVFAPRQRPSELQGRELFQMFRFDDDSNRLLSRTAVAMPASMTARHFTTCMAVGPKYGLAVVGSITPWKSERDRATLCVVRYRATAGDRVANIDDFATSDELHLPGPDQRIWAARPTSAVFCDDGSQVYLLLGGGGPDHRYGGSFSGGVFVFSLGKLGGPFKLERPIAVAPLPNGVEQLRVVDQHVLVSSRGLHAVRLADLLSVRGIAKPSIFTQRYPLPYDTHGFDTAIIQGQSYLFLAAGRNGLDAFLLRDKSSAESTRSEAAPPKRTKNRTLMGKRVEVALETGVAYRQLAAPALNDAGAVACWGVTSDCRETIVIKQRDADPVTVAASGEKYCSFGSPALNSQGDIAFWAGRRDGRNALVVWRDGRLQEQVDGRGYRWISEPRLANEGSIAFAAQPSSRRERGRLLTLMNPRAQRRVVFDETRSEQKLGTGVHGDFVGDFDVSPDGGRIAFVIRDAKKQQNELRVWSTQRAKSLGSPGRDMQLVRFGVDGEQLSFRRWRDEVLAVCTLKADGSRTQTRGVLVNDAEKDVMGGTAERLRRRSVYTAEQIHLGEFLHARTDSEGALVASVVEHVQGGNVERCLGAQIWRLAGDGQPEVLVRPLAAFGGAPIVLHSEFSGGLNRGGQVSARIDWVDGTGDGAAIQQSIVIWPVANQRR